MKSAQHIALLFVVTLVSATAGADERSFEIRYRAEVTEITDTAGKIALWIPLPRSHMDQTIRDLNIKASEDYEVVQDAEFGNRYAYIEITDEEAIAEMESMPWIEVTANVTRKRVNALESPYSMHHTKGDLGRFLGPTMMISLEGPIHEEARRVVGDEARQFEQAQMLYNHIVSTVDYDKSGTGWGRGDSLFVCDTRAGNCTEFHSLFMAEARSLQIPARFIIGFPLPANETAGEVAGYHCWAEFFTPERGWVPVDASEAQKNPARKDELFGGLDPDRVEFTIGRDIQLPKSESQPLNFSIYPHLEFNGTPSQNIQWSLKFSNIDE